MKKIQNILVFIIFALAFGLIFYIGYLMFAPIKYFESPQPYKVLNENKIVKIGDDLIYEAEYCKYRDYIPTRVNRSLVDGFTYDLPVSTSNNFTKGCHTVAVTVPMIVPASFPVNHKYRLHIAIDYKLNPFRTESRTFDTEDFILIK